MRPVPFAPARPLATATRKACARATPLLLFAGLSASGAGAVLQDPSPADAMAFVRVVADVRVEYADGSRPSVERKGVELGTGSGFVIAPSGLVLTSRHVVAEEPPPRSPTGVAAEVTLENRRVEVAIGPGGAAGVFEAYVAASDAESDLAVLQVTAGDLAYLPLGDSDAVGTGRPVKVLGFPFGRQVEVGRPPGADVVPDVTVTAGSFSAARAGEGGDTRFLQTDAKVNPGNSGGPMLDEDGYVVGVVRMKLARDATSQGAGFAVPVNVVKDFLDAHGLLGLLPVARLLPGVVHSFDWKGLRVELPDGFQDGSPSRLRVATGELGDGVSFRVDRVATKLDPQSLEQAMLGGQALPGLVPGLVPGPASPLRQAERGQPARRVGTALGARPGGERFRVEYAVMDLKGEAVVARYLGPPDALAFNLGLLRRSLETLEAGRLLTAEVSQPLAPALVPAELPGVDGGRVAMPAGWSLEPTAASACARVPPADTGLAASPAGDFTVVLRVLKWGSGGAGLGAAMRACGGGADGYAGRFDRLGVAMEARGALVERGGEALLLELEAPAAKRPFVEELFERWLRAAGR